MAGTDYDVGLKISAKDAGAKSTLDAMARRMTGLQAGAAGVSSGLRRVTESALGFAASQIGMQAIAGTFRALVTDTVRFASSMEQTKVGIGAVLAATQPALSGIADAQERMAAAGAVGDAIFRQLEEDAVKSVATSAQLAEIYSEIAGPLIGAGASMANVRDITNDTVSAAASLGVDFAQARRDIAMMATGAAGTDVRLFRMLRSVNAITESTDEWNKMLPEKRLKRIGEALSTFGPAAERFGKSLPGALSTFSDLVQRFRQTFAGPILQRFTAFLNRFNTLLLENQDRIRAILLVVGQRIAPVFEWIFGKIEAFTTFFISSWDKIATRIETVLERFKKLAPGLAIGAVAAKAGVPTMVGRMVTGAAGAASAAGTRSSLGGYGALTTMLTKVEVFFTRLATAFAPLAVLAGVVGFVVENFRMLKDTFMAMVPVLIGVLEPVWALIAAFGKVLWPILKAVGAFLVLGIYAGFALIAAVFGWMAPLLTKAAEGLALFGSWLNDLYIDLKLFFMQLFEDLKMIFEYFGGSVTKPPQTIADEAASGTVSFLDQVREAMKAFGSQSEKDKALLASTEAGAPSDRQKAPVNDFRGSKIEVKQDFREADPDRVWLQMVQGINQAAEGRLASALAPDFAR